MRKTLLKRVSGVNRLLTNHSGFPKRGILNMRDAKLGFLLKDSKKTISHGIKDYNFYIRIAILTMAHAETITFTI